MRPQHIYNFHIQLTTNPDEYGYFCDPDPEQNIGEYKKRYSRNYTYNNPNNTIYESKEYIDNDNKNKDSIENLKKYINNRIDYPNTIIYSCIIIGSMLVTSYLVHKEIL